MANWLDKYEQGGMVLKKKTKDNYGKRENPNDVKASVGPDFVGLGYNTKGRDYSPAWGGQFQNGGIIVNDPKDPRLKAYQDSLNIYNKSNKLQKDLKTKLAQPWSKLKNDDSFGNIVKRKEELKQNKIKPIDELFYGFKNEKGEAVSHPKFTYGFVPVYKKPTKPVNYQQPEPSKVEVKKVKGSKKYFINETEVDEAMFNRIVPKKDMAMGGALPGAVGFTYARTAGSAPANGKYTKKTKASAQNGTEMAFYQNGLDFTPKSISKNGSVIKDDRGQWAYPGEVTEIGSNNITMQGVDYPVLGVSDTGDTQMMQPNQDYKFDGEKVTEYPMMQKGGWLDKYPEPMRQDATRNVIPRKMTTQEKKEAEEASKKAIVANKARDEKIIAERKKNISTKGDLNTPGSWHTEDKFRMFPGDINGVGEMIDEYINPATYVGLLTDALGESIAKRDPKGIATSLALSALGGVLGVDPLGNAIKSAKGFVKPSFTSGKEALDFLNTKVDDIGEENVIKIISKKTGKTRKQIEDEFDRAIGNVDNPRNPEYIIRQANIVNGKFDLPKFPKSLKELDEKAGKLVSKPNNIGFDKKEIINRANELLEKGVGIKKKNISVKLESTPGNEILVKVNDNNPQLYLNDAGEYITNTAYDKSGYMNLQPNFSDMNTNAVTFTDWLKGKKPETKFVSNWGTQENPAFTKIGDFPYEKRPDLKGTGVGAEAAEAMKQALEEKGIKLQSSTNHTGEGRLRYLTEFLNDRKKAINTEGNPGWIDVVNNIKESLKGKKVSKNEVKELMNLNPKIDPIAIQFQYKDGGWLDNYK